MADVRALHDRPGVPLLGVSRANQLALEHTQVGLAKLGSEAYLERVRGGNDLRRLTGTREVAGVDGSQRRAGEAATYPLRLLHSGPIQRDIEMPLETPGEVVVSLAVTNQEQAPRRAWRGATWR